MSTRIHPDEMSTRIHPNTVHQNSPNKNFHQNSPKHCPLELGKCVHQNSPQMSTRIHPLMSTRFLQPKKRHFKARILQNLLKNKNCLLIEPQMARNINLIKTGQRGKKWGFSAIHRTSNTRRKSNLHPHQSQFTLPTLQRDTLQISKHFVQRKTQLLLSKSYGHC